MINDIIAGWDHKQPPHALLNNAVVPNGRSAKKRKKEQTETPIEKRNEVMPMEKSIAK